MDKFFKYFEDKSFIRWVLNPTSELEEHWQSYIKNNPAEKEQIKKAYLLVSQLKSNGTNDLETDKYELYESILKDIEKKNKKKSFHRIGITMAKYAAVAIIFFSIGILSYYFYQDRSLPAFGSDISFMDKIKHPHLVLGDGQSVRIEDDEPNISHQKDGVIVINKKDTIQTKPSIKEKNWNKVYVPYGRNSNVTLPDGSVVYLNAGSQLAYPSNFENGREVHLMGEAYFNVNHDPENPFRVKTDGYEVEVLGTKFNLSAYPSQKVIETVLVEGKVKLKEAGFRLTRNDIILEPNQRAAFRRDSNFTHVNSVNVENYVSWHQGFLSAENLELNRITKRLELYYNIQIELQKPILGITSITGKLELNEDPDSVLIVLANTASLELVKINKSKYIFK